MTPSNGVTRFGLSRTLMNPSIRVEASTNVSSAIYAIADRHSRPKATTGSRCDEDDQARSRKRVPSSDRGEF